MSTTPRKLPVKDLKFNLRIDRELKAAAEKAAAKDNRSLASLIVKLLRDYLDTQKKKRQ
jgi:predicted HicB family RNase H-like nuclease